MRKINENDGLDWIRDVKPSLRNTYFYFEPMIGVDDIYFVLNKLVSLKDLESDELTWSSGSPLTDDIISRVDLVFLHHLLIDNNNSMVWGGYQSNNYYEGDEHYYEQCQDNTSYYIEDSNDFFGVKKLNGREFFNL